MKDETYLTRSFSNEDMPHILTESVNVQYGFQSRAFFMPRLSWLFVIFLFLRNFHKIGGSKQEIYYL